MRVLKYFFDARAVGIDILSVCRLFFLRLHEADATKVLLFILLFAFCHQPRQREIEEEEEEEEQQQQQET